MSEKTGFDILNFYNTDQRLEKDGAKMMLHEDPTGKAYFIVRPYPNDDRTRLISKLYADNQSVLSKITEGTEAEILVATQLDTELTAEANATHVLVGCGGMKEPYSVEFGKRCMMNHRIRDRILRFAVDLSNYRAKEEDIKKK